MDQPVAAPELFFEAAEYAQRLAGVRANMAKAGIEVLCCSTPENLFYVTGYQTIGYTGFQLLVIPMEGQPFLILRFLESMLAGRYSWITDVATFDDTDDPVALTIEQLRKRGLLGKRVAIEERAPFLQVAVWRKLNDGIPNLTDGSYLVDAVRAVKSPAELGYMRKAARQTDLGMQAAVDTIRAGASENDVAAAVFSAMTRAGAEYLTRDPIVTSGERAGIPHTCYMRRELRAGDTVLLEFSGNHTRYHSPLMRAALIGRNAEIERISDVCIETLHAAMAAIKPGVTSGEVDAAARAVIVKAGLWENYRKRTGYSVGVGLYNWMEIGVGTLKDGDDSVLRQGMCFHLPIAVRLYGVAAVACSETVHITADGCEALGQFPRALAFC